MSISSIFPSAQRTALTLHHQIEQYESGKDISEQMEREISDNINLLTRDIQEMDQLSNQEGNRKEMWKKRIKPLSDECHELRLAFTRCQKQHTRRKEKESESEVRQQLFAGYQRNKDLKDNIDFQVRTNDSLIHSHNVMDDMFAMGQAALQNLQVQRSTLKNARRKALDIASTLGLSSSVLRLMERAERHNAWITYGCMIFTLLVIFLTYYYFKIMKAVPST